MNGNNIKCYIICSSYDQVMAFAASELERYLKMMMPGAMKIIIANAGIEHCDDESVIKLGLFRDFGLETAEIEDEVFDDAINIDIAGLTGIIAGSNARSVLLAVYRFLHEAGCRWVRPGIDGEYIPRKDMYKESVKLQDKPSYRHRGFCIEGAVSYENMAENIEWAPKVGINSYFLEFITPYTFFDKWYSHEKNKYKKPEPITVETAEKYTKKLEAEIKKRGLLYHAVGHAWTCEPFGIRGLGWDKGTYDIDDETRSMLAEVNGKRDIWCGVPLNTNLCYSNPKVRRIVVNYCAEHVRKNPHIDVLHFWLADSVNSHCECEQCKNLIPSDYYVMLLNEIDDELSRLGINTKIVFLLYLDLLWAPEKERLKNPDRFLLLFAPISRTYSSSYTTDDFKGKLPDYKRNKLVLPKDIAENVAHLRDWQKVFTGDSLAYEYHFMWDHYNDPGYYEMGRVLLDDIKHLKDLKLNGFISDQTQRSFLPTGFGMYLMGRALWNDKVEFNNIADDYFKSAFGEDGDRCRDYMAKLSELFDPAYIRGEKGWRDAAAAEKLGKVRGIVEQFLPVIVENLNLKNKCHAKSWEYLKFHSELVIRMADAFKARAEGEADRALKLWEAASDYVQCIEDEVQPVFDVYTFIKTMEHKFIDNNTNV